MSVAIYFDLKKTTLINLKKEIQKNKRFMKKYGRITKTRKLKRLSYDYEFMTSRGFYGVLDLKKSSKVIILTYTGKKDFTSLKNTI
tara:strand:+ start:433 stop:690 length:258 start_codon:yes stop_codon:yes gene_type:complete